MSGTKNLAQAAIEALSGPRIRSGVTLADQDLLMTRPRAEDMLRAWRARDVTKDETIYPVNGVVLEFKALGGYVCLAPYGDVSQTGWQRDD